MECYVTKDDARFALQKMQNFYRELNELYSSHGFNLTDNLGRRNILMSHAQEAFFAEALKRKYPGTRNDGATGEPDIFIPELNRELECKLTSRHSSGAISFQSDFETLHKKGSLDYLYIISSEDFNSFNVLYYRGLTVDDFRNLSPGSRGKVQLKKHVANSKLTVLFGNVEDIREGYIRNISQQINSSESTFTAKHKKLEERLRYWKNANSKYKFHTEALNAC